MDFSTLLPGETDDQVFRIVVLPADFVAKKSVDINDINTVLQNPQIQLNVINKITPVEIDK